MSRNLFLFVLMIMVAASADYAHADSVLDTGVIEAKGDLK